MHLVLVTAYPPSQESLNEYGFHLAKVLQSKPEITRLTILADEVRGSENDPAHVQRVWRFNDPRNPLRIQRALGRLRPDVVLYNVQFASFGNRRLPGGLGLLSPALSRLRGVPTITLLHNIFETVDLKQAGYSASRLADAVTRLAGTVLTRALLQSNLVALTLPQAVETSAVSHTAWHVVFIAHPRWRRRPGAR